MTDNFDILSPLSSLKSEPVYAYGGAALKLYRGADAALFGKAAQVLLQNGYEKVSENNIAGNLSLNFVGSEYLAHIYFTPCDGCIRAVFDKNTTLPPLVQSADGDTTLWQFEVDHSLIDCGMCYIIKCADGSFFLIDSAHFYSINDNERIYRFLRERTPQSEKIRIAGWFFSHGHIDHTSKFMDFVRDEHSDVELERIIFNFCPADHRDSDNWSESDKLKQRQFEAFAASLDNMQIITPHTGQRFCIRNLVVDVLCTHDDVYPNSLENYNDSSTVIRIQANGSVLLFPGDAGGEESEVLTSRYGKELKCDILQAAHHGHFGTSVLFYELCDAGVILFPTTQIKYDEEFPRYEANRRAVEISEECYIASNGTAEFNLPFKVGFAKVLPDETFEDFEGIKNLWGYEYTDDRKKQLFDEYLSRKGD